MAEGKILPYLDIPLQHASRPVLKLMKRPGSVDRQLARIKAVARNLPRLTLRSTFYCRLSPGETEEDFQMLLDATRKRRASMRVGCFKYSRWKAQAQQRMAAGSGAGRVKERWNTLCSCNSKSPLSACGKRGRPRNSGDR